MWVGENSLGMRVAADIVAVKRNIDGADGDGLLGRALRQAQGQALGQGDAAVGNAEEQEVFFALMSVRPG